MCARVARLALLSALAVIAACVTGYLLSAPTDAAPRIFWHKQERLSMDVQAAMAGRQRPDTRPERSDYDDPSRRVRSSALEALLHRPDGARQD
jgi:hypothetical protein